MNWSLLTWERRQTFYSRELDKPPGCLSALGSNLLCVVPAAEGGLPRTVLLLSVCPGLAVFFGPESLLGMHIPRPCLRPTRAEALREGCSRGALTSLLLMLPPAQA